jgi:hypothetical protein
MTEAASSASSRNARPLTPGLVRTPAAIRTRVLNRSARAVSRTEPASSSRRRSAAGYGSAWIRPALPTRAQSWGRAASLTGAVRSPSWPSARETGRGRTPPVLRILARRWAPAATRTGPARSRCSPSATRRITGWVRTRPASRIPARFPAPAASGCPVSWSSSRIARGPGSVRAPVAARIPAAPVLGRWLAEEFGTRGRRKPSVQGTAS